MTVTARRLGDPSVQFGYLDRLVKSASGEVVGMPKSVPRFSRVLPDDVVRSVAVITSRDRLVARLQPAAVLILHYVAVGTSERVVAHVRVTLAVPKCIHAYPGGQAEPDAEDDVFKKIN